MMEVSNTPVCCAIYTRKSSEEGLEQDFNSIHAQREACELYVLSQKHQNWYASDNIYDDGGFSGGNTERPALKRLMQDIEHGVINIIVVYKIDRLSRSIADFSRLVEFCEEREVALVSVTESFNTRDAMGKLTLNMLMSFAQYEREITAERIRDKIAASKRRGMWMGGPVPFGYKAVDRRLEIDPEEAPTVRDIFERFVALGSTQLLAQELRAKGVTNRYGKPFDKVSLHKLIRRPVYRGLVAHKGETFPGQHEALVSPKFAERVDAVFEAPPHTRSNALRGRTPALLKGLIFDADGRAMSPTHTRRKRKIYRYYTSQSLLKGQEACAPGRVNAQEIEDAVLVEIKTAFKKPEALVALSRAAGTASLSESELRKHVDQWSLLWDQLAPHEQARLVSLIVRRVDVLEDRLEVSFRPFGGEVCKQPARAA